MGQFFFTILAGFAEMERELIKERILLGLDRRRKEGKKLLKGKKKSRKENTELKN